METTKKAYMTPVCEILVFDYMENVTASGDSGSRGGGGASGGWGGGGGATGSWGNGGGASGGW